MPEKTETTLVATVPTPLAKALKKKLIDDDIFFREWLIERINLYLKGGDKK